MMVNVVVVTYNRKDLLLRCVNAVLNQSISIQRLVIVDNASNDGTLEALVEAGLANQDHSDVCIEENGILEYMRLNENLGGAGGFHYGMKQAVKDDPDFIWVMDDDGYPANDCLEHLLEYVESYDYIMPVSFDVQEKDTLSFFMRRKEGQKTISYKQLCQSWSEGIVPYAMPFNGLLLSRKLVKVVGFPNRHMFIWGDEWEHQLRCIKSGFDPITILSAKFYHPADRSNHPKILFGLIPINYSTSKLRFTCLIRNSTYNYWHYKGKHFIVAKLLIYSWFFLVHQKFALKDYHYYLKCVGDGIRGDFSRHLKYILPSEKGK